LAKSASWRSLAKAWPDGRIKLALMARILAVRRALAKVFTHGDYRPLDVSGRDRNEILAFARRHNEHAVLVIVARWFSRSTDGGRRWPPPDAWDASISVRGYAELQHLLISRAIATRPELAIHEMFDAIPVAILEARKTHSIK
jgi:(1->4)-alpha-D-glucan 1-alpha-D-glucosylmutase